MLVLAVLVPRPGAAQTEQRCFSETGYCISGGIRAYWEGTGGLAVFGFPSTALTSETNADGFTGPTQWFEPAPSSGMLYGDPSLNPRAITGELQ